MAFRLSSLSLSLSLDAANLLPSIFLPRSLANFNLTRRSRDRMAAAPLAAIDQLMVVVFAA